MALTYIVRMELQRVGLVDLMTRQRDLWLRKTTEAYDFTVRSVGIAKPRPDDVIQVLEPGLQVAEALRNHLSQKKLHQQYWYHRFGDLLIDEFWDELTRPQP